ncbi:MAG: glycosyltransferase [Cyanobacteria bacterium P01_G01_bin.19]
MSFAPLPHVSVVIPTYNSADFLVKALESVFSQTYQNYEVVLVDDGSTDNTKTVIEPYLSRITYVYQENQGVAAARNKGIAVAKGRLIAFLDADDLFLPHKLEQQIDLLSAKSDVGMVISGWQISDRSGKITNCVELWKDLPELDLRSWLYWKPVLPSATMIRRQWLEKVGGFPNETVPVEDVECFINIIVSGCKAEWCREIGTTYRQINPNSLCRNTLQRVKSLELLHQRFFGRANLPVEIKQEENQITYCNLVWSAWHLYQNGYSSQMCAYLHKSLASTAKSAAEISLHWVKSFTNYCEIEGRRLDTYKITQSPGWDKLTIATLATRQPKVSVVIPAYNSAKYLAEAIASVLAQTYIDYEIILINDGSTDNTNEVIEPYLNSIRYFTQENQGVSSTRNRGIYLARGELIAFLDADDILLPTKLEKQVALFTAQPDLAIVNSGFRLITETGEKIRDIERWYTIPELTPKIWLLHKPVLPSAMMFKKSWLLKVGGFDARFFASEDVDVVLRMAIWGCKSAWLKEITACYRQHPTSATTAKPIAQMANAELMQECFFARQDIPQSWRKLERQARYDFLVWMAGILYQANCVPEAIAYLKKSLAYTPYSWAETVTQWIQSFRNSAELNACPFDVYALSQLSAWQELIIEMRVSKLLDLYSSQATEYQTLATYQPTPNEASLYAAAYAQLGNKLMSENDLEQAVIWLRKAIALEPDNCCYREALGNALVKKYELDSAVATYRQAIRLKPTYQPFRAKLHEALRLQDHWRDLTKYCEKLIDTPNSSQKLRMLAIFPYPPYPPQKGGASIRMFEQIKYFGSRHSLTVVSFVFDDVDLQIESELAEYCDRAFIIKLGTPKEPYQPNIPRQLHNFTTWNMWQVLQQLSQVDFDVVSFEFIVASVYQNLFCGRFMVLNEHNIESRLLRRCATADKDNLIPDLAQELDAAKAFLDSESEAELLERYENQNWRKFPLRTVVSAEDKQELDSRCNVGKTLVVKNGIDVKKFQPVGNFDRRKILFMGTMSYYPNIDGVMYFVAQILPIILSQSPDLSFCIAGREPPKLIEDLASENQQIEVIRNPEDMSFVAAECSLSVVPLRSGSGTRIKILHSMAMGLPVVSTSIGCEGLQIESDRHLLIRDTPEEFALATIKLTQERRLWDKLGDNGRQLVEKHYDWTAIFSEYERELQNGKSKL